MEEMRQFVLLITDAGSFAFGLDCLQSIETCLKHSVFMMFDGNLMFFLHFSMLNSQQIDELRGCCFLQSRLQLYFAQSDGILTAAGNFKCLEYFIRIVVLCYLPPPEDVHPFFEALSFSSPLHLLMHNLSLESLLPALGCQSAPLLDDPERLVLVQYLPLASFYVHLSSDAVEAAQQLPQILDSPQSSHLLSHIIFISPLQELAALSLWAICPQVQLHDYNLNQPITHPQPPHPTTTSHPISLTLAWATPSSPSF